MTSLADQAVAYLAKRSALEKPDRVPGSTYGAGERSVLRGAGWEPCGLVAGASVYHIGLVGWPQGNVEVGQLSGALNSGRDKALAGLRAHALRLHAEGIIDVRLDVRFREDHRHLPRFVMSGTAVRRVTGLRQQSPLKGGRADAPVSSADDGPFTAAITPSQFVLLLEAGYQPLGVVMGTCVFHIGRRGFAQWASTQRQNVEMTGYTEALYQARELAMSRLQEEALGLGAAGVIGVSIAEDAHIWGDHVIEFFACGTAVQEHSSADRHSSRSTTFAVPMVDPFVTTDPGSIVSPRGSR